MIGATDRRVVIVIEGRPVPCPRPKVGRGRAYYPESYETALAEIRLRTRSAFARARVQPFRGRVAVSVMFDGAHGSADLDNLLKTVLDGLSGAAYADDRQVDEVTAIKRPPLSRTRSSPPPSTRIEVFEI